MRRACGIVFSYCMALFVVACGGGGSSTPPPPPPNPPTVSPSSATVPLGGSQQFTATNFSGTVTWSVNGPGSITQAGLYTAPPTFPSPNTATIVATAGSQTANASGTVVFPNNNAGNESAPIELGTSGGNVNDNSTNGKECCIGTLGSLLQRGANLFILSNNHVLARSTLAANGELIDQPGQLNCPPGSQGMNVAMLSQQAPLKPATSPGPSPSNVDAAIAQIVPGTVDTSGAILDLGSAGSTSIGAAPPSSTVSDPAAVLAAGEHVAKSGRTTGLTCSTVNSASTDGVSVDYDSSCGGAVSFTAVFNGQFVVNGGSFSGEGDSGSLIVTADTAHPVALLYAGNTSTTVANPLLDSKDSKGNVAKGVFSAFNNGTAPTIVGGADHPISCDPTAQSQSTQVGAQGAQVSAQRQRIAAGVLNRHTAELMSLDAAIRSVKVGASSDAPGEAALVIEVSRTPSTRIPPVVEGVRTRLVYAEGVNAPIAMTMTEFNRGLSAKDNHRNEYFQRAFQGIGVGRSDDAPGEAAIVIYAVQGEQHAPIPAVIDGVRTKVMIGERFRASRWNPKLEHKAACSKSQVIKK